MTTAPFDDSVVVPLTAETAAALQAAVDYTVDHPGQSQAPADVQPELDHAAAIDAVALHVAASLSSKVTMAEREATRTRWATALRVADLANHPHWHVVYLPGLSFNDGETWAVHRTTGRVAGDCTETRRANRESTADWLDRLGAH